MERLFVYGTLAPGRPNEHVLKDASGTWQPAKVTATLIHEGWGADSGYPGLVLDENGGEVEGFIFASDNLVRMWPQLDQFEGDSYLRTEAAATLNDDATVICQVYALRRP